MSPPDPITLAPLARNASIGIFIIAAVIDDERKRSGPWRTASLRALA